ncbi:MAG: DUF3298 and DUF4163 domain-containing protein [Bacteroidota bacterium]
MKHHFTFFLLLCCLTACQTDTPTDPTPEEPTVELITPADAAVPFSTLTLQDSTALITGDSLSPWGNVRIETIVPHAEDEALNQKINKAIGRVIAGDDYPMIPTDPALHLAQAARNTLQEYRDEKVDTADVRDAPNAFSLAEDYQTKILYNERDLLFLSVDCYWYTGGAHGNYYVTFLNFDLESGKQLKAGNVFSQEGRKAVTKLLEDHFNEILGDAKFAEITETNPNFTFTQHGIKFNYAPYEIAPYAAGKQEVTLTFDRLRPHLTELGQHIANRLLAS